MKSMPKNAWREVSAAGILVMETCWIALWFRSLTRAALPVPVWKTTLVLGVFLFAATLTGMLFILLRLKSSLQMGLMVGLILVCILVGLSTLISPETAGSEIKNFAEAPLRSWGDLVDLIPSQFVVVGFILFIWWRGINYSKLRVSPSAVAQAFRTGILLLILSTTFLTRILKASPPLWLFFLFLIAGLLALAAARASIAGVFRGGRISPFDRRWFGELFAAVFSVTGAAYLAALLLVSQRERLAGWLEGIFYFLGVLISTPVVLLVSLLARPLARIQPYTNLAPTPTPSVTEVAGQSAGQASPFQLDLSQPGSLDLMERLRFLLVWGSVLLVVILLALVLRSAMKTARRIRVEQADEPAAFEGLGGFLRLLVETLLGSARAAGAGLAGRLSRGDRLLAAARIRRIFYQFLELCADLGQPRPAAQTPYEFLPSARTLFPARTEELTAVTAAYVAVRYGQLPETEAQVQEVERAWDLIREDGEARKGEMKTSKRHADVSV